MSHTTYEAPLSWNVVLDSKTMDFAVYELPGVGVKPEMKVVITPLPYDDRLRKFLERPATNPKTTPAIPAPVPTTEEQDQIPTTPVETPATASQAEEVQDNADRRVYLTSRERLSKWWKQEKAEQKAFRNAMAPYVVF